MCVHTVSGVLQAIAQALASATSTGGQAAASAAAQALASGGSLARKRLPLEHAQCILLRQLVCKLQHVQTLVPSSPCHHCQRTAVHNLVQNPKGLQGVDVVCWPFQPSIACLNLTAQVVFAETRLLLRTCQPAEAQAAAAANARGGGDASAVASAVAEARALQAESSLSQVCRGISTDNSTAILTGIQQCPPENTTAISTALAQAAVSNTTVAPVAEAAGAACAAGLNTSVMAECIAAAYATGGAPAEAMSAALTKAAQTGGCAGVAQALAGEQQNVLVKPHQAWAGYMAGTYSCTACSLRCTDACCCTCCTYYVKALSAFRPYKQRCVLWDTHIFDRSERSAYAAGVTCRAVFGQAPACCGVENFWDAITV